MTTATSGETLTVSRAQLLEVFAVIEAAGSLAGFRVIEGGRDDA